MTARLTQALIVAVIAGGVVVAGAAEKQPFAVADLYRLVGVDEPAIAPDGSAIVYKLTHSDLPAMKRTANLWRIAPDGSGARALTTADASDASPAFSADGRTLAFISTRSGEPQVWFMPTDGGEARKVTSWPGGVGSFQLSPDGTKVAFTADVWTTCGGDAECNRKTDEARDGSKLKAHLADRLLFRHWNEWRDGRRTHIMVQDLESNVVRDLTPGDFDSPVFSVGGGTDYAFSPDGKELVFASNRDRDEASSTNADLWAIAVDAPAEALKTPRRLTDNPAWDGGPAFSPDGRLATSSWDGYLRLYSRDFRLLAKKQDQGGSRPFQVSFSPAGRVVAGVGLHLGDTRDDAVDAQQLVQQLRRHHRGVTLSERRG